jgi:hypothetical protein
LEGFIKAKVDVNINIKKKLKKNFKIGDLKATKECGMITNVKL